MWDSCSICGGDEGHSWECPFDLDPLEAGCETPAGALRVYRGAIEQHVRHPSWSLSRAVAEEFVERLRFRRHGDAQVWQAEVPHDSVLTYLCSQDQEEVVVDPAGLRNIVTVGEGP